MSEDKINKGLRKRKRDKRAEETGFKYLNSQRRNIQKYWMLDEETLIRRAFESVFGNGLLPRKIDRKRITRLHLEILVRLGYAKDIPTISSVILTDKAFEDKDKIMRCEK